MTKPKIYEIEIQRNNISPKQFFTYCKKQMEKRAGISIENWVECFDDWAHPVSQSNNVWTHSDWDTPQKEISKTMPYDWQLYLGETYNFIMEFQFDDDNVGYGYMYAVEFER